MGKQLNISSAVDAIAKGEVIAYPTEAIYGLGCNPENLQAVQSVLDLKARDANKGLILIASRWEQLIPYVDEIEPDQLQKALDTWPGPVTWVMPAHPSLDALLTGGRSTVAVRVTDHPVVIELCNQCNHPLVSTSANISGQVPVNYAHEIATEFGDAIAGVVEGELGGLKSATSIYDLLSGAQIR